MYFRISSLHHNNCIKKNESIRLVVQIMDFLCRIACVNVVNVMKCDVNLCIGVDYRGISGIQFPDIILINSLMAHVQAVSMVINLVQQGEPLLRIHGQISVAMNYRVC